MYIYTYLYTYIYIYIYIHLNKCADLTWNSARQLEKVCWLATGDWLENEKSFPTSQVRCREKVRGLRHLEKVRWLKLERIALSHTVHASWKGVLKSAPTCKCALFHMSPAMCLQPIPLMGFSGIWSNCRPNRIVCTPPRQILLHGPHWGRNWSWESSAHPTCVRHKTIQTQITC